MRPNRPRRRLVAVDTKTHRSYGIGLSYAVDEVNPDLFGAMIAETAWTIARECTRRYGVPFVWDRIAWRVETEGDQTPARQLAAAKAVHDV